MLKTIGYMPARTGLIPSKVPSRILELARTYAANRLLDSSILQHEAKIEKKASYVPEISHKNAILCVTMENAGSAG